MPAELAGAGTVAPGVTLADRIGEGASLNRPVVFADSGEATTWGRIHARAQRVAGALRGLGVAPGDRVAMLAPTTEATVTAIEAVWLAGSALVMLPVPARVTDPAVLADEERRRLAAARANLLVVDPSIEAFARTLGGPRTCTTDELLAASRDAAPWTDTSLRPSHTAVVQFTSGSTSDPRGAVISHANVVANLAAIAARIGLDPDRDTMASWLPLFHDMGLFGFLALPMATGSGAVLADPASFLGDPGRWMAWVAHYRAAFSGGPSFAYAMATRAFAGRAGLDLSHVRALFNGSEPIDPAVARRFTDAAARHRLPRSALTAAYGMAEATLVVSVERPAIPLRTDTIERAALEHEELARPLPDGFASGGPEAIELVACGPPLQGTEVEVRAADGTVLPERSVGQLVVRGPAVAAGYLSCPEATAERFARGWLRTGDRGYLADGEVVVCGRDSDLLIVAGRNLHPEDVERVAARVDGVRAGNVVAVGTTGPSGETRVVVVAEHRSGSPEALRTAVRREVHKALGVRLAAVELLAPGQLPKTSSGKLMRARVRAALAERGAREEEAP